MDQPQAESTEYTMEEGIQAIDSLLGSDTGPEPEEVTEEAQPETEADKEEAEPEEDEAEAEESEDDSEEDSEEAEPEEETEEPQIESLADLAEALDVPLEELQANLKTKIKVQGEELEVTLAELSQGYQKDADYRQKTSELSEQRKAFTQAYEQANERLNQEFYQLGQLQQAVAEMALPKVDQSELEYLKQTDPQQYLIRKGEIEDAQNRFAQIQQAASQTYQQHAQQLQAWQEQQRQEAIAKAKEELPHRVPDFGPQLKQELDAYLTSDHFGYTPEELAQITDPRLIELVNKARLWDTKGQQVETTKQKVKKLPKVQKPQKAAVKTKVSNIEKAKKRLASTGSLEDAASAIANLI